MIKAVAALVFAFMASTTFTQAEQWVSLGGMNSEIDLDSVSRAGAPSAWIRTSGRTEQGILTTYFYLAAYCDRGFLYTVDGQIISSWSTTVAPMPDLPDADRTFWMPSPNVALSNAFVYLCGSSN